MNDTNLKERILEIMGCSKYYDVQYTISEGKVINIVEERGLSGLKYSKVCGEMIEYIKKYAYSYIPNNCITEKYYFNNGKDVKDLHVWIYDILVPNDITKKISFIEKLNFHVILKRVIVENIEAKIYEYLRNAGSGSNTSNKYDTINKDNQLKNGEIEIVCYMINDEFIDSTFKVSFFHEINHAYENYKRLLNYQKNSDLKEKNLYYKLNNINYIGKTKLFNSSNEYDLAMGEILYRLWTDSERNALATHIYGDLDSMKSKKENFSKDLKKSSAYEIYFNLKNNCIPLINSLNNSELWQKYMQILGFKYNYMNKDIDAFKKSFIKRSNILLNSLFHNIGKVASLYYDQSEGIDLTNKAITI